MGEYTPQDNAPRQPPMNATQNYQNPKIKLNPEELLVLRQCNRDSFWYRCLPLGTVMAIPTYRYTGSSVKCFLAALAGYLIGKMSYAGVCRNKLMQLQNSPLADAMRKRDGKEMESPGNLTPGVLDHFQIPVESSDLENDDFRSNIDLSTDQNIEHKGLDDTQRPTLDRDVLPVDQPITQRQYTNYEDLRAKNREEYEAKAAQDRRQLAPTVNNPRPSPAALRRPRESSRKQATSIGSERNQYGDVWDK